MVEENINQEFRLKNIDETRSCSIEEIKQNKLMIKNHQKVCATLNYVEHLFILASVVTRCVSISAFASLIVSFLNFLSSVVGTNICAITARIKTYKPIIKEKRRNIK